MFGTIWIRALLLRHYLVKVRGQMQGISSLAMRVIATVVTVTIAAFHFMSYPESDFSGASGKEKAQAAKAIGEYSEIMYTGHLRQCQ